METERERVRRLVGEAGSEVLTRAMASSGMCCAGGAPLCTSCLRVTQGLKTDLAAVVQKIPAESIEKLATAPDDMIKRVFCDLIEPDFRRAVAKNFTS